MLAFPYVWQAVVSFSGRVVLKWKVCGTSYYSEWLGVHGSHWKLLGVGRRGQISGPNQALSGSQPDDDADSTLADDMECSGS